MAADTAIDIKHLYKISKSDGTYLGLLPKVSSDFGYSQQINTVLSQLSITVGASIDTAEQVPDPVLDESGNVVLDENGDTVYADGAGDLIGDNNPNTLIQEDNLVEVLEFSPYSPNGEIVFLGYISQVEGNIANGDDIEITCLTRGQDADNIEIPGDTADTLDQSQATHDANQGADIYDTASQPQWPGQSFKTGSGVTNISKIDLWIYANGDRTIKLELYNNVNEAWPATTTPLATATKAIPGSTGNAGALFTFTFSSPIPVSALTDYFWVLKPADGVIGDDPYVGAASANSNAYGNGQGYTIKGGINPIRTNYASDGTTLDDFYFKTYYSHATTEHAYANTSDVSDILTDVMGNYNVRGGVLQIPDGGYDPTGVVTPYTFKLNTVLEGFNKVLELGPSDWHGYADVAAEELHYQQDGTTADHTLLKARHINDLKLASSKEEIINVCYVTGGPDATGNNNIFTKVTDAQSIAANRIGLARLTDNRAQGTDGLSIAQLLAQNHIDRHSSKTYNTTVTVPMTAYDINLFKPGQMVGFGNFGTSVDDLLLQIVAIHRLRDQVALTLGTLPRRDDRRVEALSRQLNDVQTLANPDAPS